jgi:prepilin peptidase CpaA
MVLLAPVLIAVALGDLSRLRISNRLVAVTLVLFAITVPIFAADEIALRLAAGLAIFAVLTVLFALGLMGGGDVKMLPAVLLFVPPEHWGNFAFLLSFALLLGVTGVGAARMAVSSRGPTGWLALDTPRAFPMGVSIALAGLLLPAFAFAT